MNALSAAAVVVYFLTAAAVVGAGVAWVADWRRYRRGLRQKPAEVSPVSETTLGYSFCAAVGAACAGAAGSLTLRVTDALFVSFCVGLAVSCSAFILERWHVRARIWMGVVASMVAGAVLAIAG
jgi:hypothetical protein